MTLEWDYRKGTCDISMPGYVANVLKKFQHDTPRNPQHTPSKYVTPFYGANARLGVLFYFGEKPPNDDKLNGFILNSAAIIKNVVESAA
jgi:hypothetical protein